MLTLPSDIGVCFGFSVTVMVVKLAILDYRYLLFAARMPSIKKFTGKHTLYLLKMLPRPRCWVTGAIEKCKRQTCKKKFYNLHSRKS